MLTFCVLIVPRFGQKGPIFGRVSTHYHTSVPPHVDRVFYRILLFSRGVPMVEALCPCIPAATLLPFAVWRRHPFTPPTLSRRCCRRRGRSGRYFPSRGLRSRGGRGRSSCCHCQMGLCTSLFWRSVAEKYERITNGFCREVAHARCNRRKYHISLRLHAPPLAAPTHLTVCQL